MGCHRDGPGTRLGGTFFPVRLLTGANQDRRSTLWGDKLGPRSKGLLTAPGRFSSSPRRRRAFSTTRSSAPSTYFSHSWTKARESRLVREGEGVGAQVLVSLGVNLPRVRQQVVELLESYGVPARVMTPEAESRRSRGKETSSIERVGREWFARVVRPGRTPPDYEAAYEELESLFEGLGIAVWG
jgi:hypothetical protein